MSRLSCWLRLLQFDRMPLLRPGFHVEQEGPMLKKWQWTMSIRWETSNTRNISFATMGFASAIPLSKWSTRDRNSLKYSNKFIFSITEAGQFWTGTQCQSCHGSCETCSDFSNENCLTCRSPTMFQSPGSCVEQCSPGFYPDLRFGNYATCQPCPHPCIECVSRTNCTMCHSPLLLQTGQCRTTCAPGYVYCTMLYSL